MAPSDSRFGRHVREIEQREHRYQRERILTATTSALRGLPRNRISTRNTSRCPRRWCARPCEPSHRTRLSRSMYGNDAHVLAWRAAAVELVDLGVDALQGLRRVLILQHQHDAFDRVRVAVLAEDAFALLVTEGGATEVAHQHRCSVDLRHHDRADLLQVVNQADAADDIALVAARDAAAAGVGVVVVDRIDDIRDAEAIVLELLGIDDRADASWWSPPKLISSTTPGPDFQRRITLHR